MNLILTDLPDSGTLALYEWSWYILLRLVRSQDIRETGVQSQVVLYQRLKKMVLDIALLKYYKLRIKGKVEQSKEKGCALPYISV